MKVFELMATHDYEQVVFGYDRKSGLKAIIALHNTALGPAIGGCRMIPYTCEEEAFKDVLKLSRAMTYKSAAAGINAGGGKSVIIGNSATDKTEELFLAFGRLVHSLAGKYIVAEDVGTTMNDMDIILRETPYVNCTSPELGGSGNAAPATAVGTFQGIRAGLQVAFGSPDPAGKTIAIQGLGGVGAELCQHLTKAGAKLIVTDIDQKRVDFVVKEYNAQVCAPEEIFDQECDVFSPCALGGVLNPNTIPRLRCRIVAGCANNQLQDPSDAEHLVKRNILYAPDFVCSAGGVIEGFSHRAGENAEKKTERIMHIFDTAIKIMTESQKTGKPTNAVAEELAEERFLGR